MSELRALESQSCPACGAQATWDPARLVLKCPYCGTESPTEIDPATGEIRELDLAAALREAAERRERLVDRRAVRCAQCQAVSIFEASRVGQNCEFCGSPQLVDYEEIEAPLRPQGVLPFQVNRVRVREAMRAWFAGRWLAPGKLKRSAFIDRVGGVYLPYWTFDARVRAEWRAESGAYYYQAVRVRGPDGRPRTQMVRRVRWRPAAGSVEHFFDDEPIAGSRGLHAELARKIEPFPLKELKPYDASYLAGFAVEHYQVVLIDAARRARDSMNAQLREMCARQVPGDTYRGLQVEARYAGETFKYVLAPVWLLSYDYGRKSYQAVVNGSTGAVAGEYPKSPWKILLLVLAALLAAALIAWFVAR